MNSFVVFLAIVAVASANVAGRTGWAPPPPAPAPGWGAPAPATVILAVDAAAAAVGEGQASAHQDLAEVAVGDASISSVNGVSAIVAQGLVDPNTATYNEVSAYNLAQGTDSLQAVIQGDELAAVTNVAGTDASGAGAIAIEASSTNLQILPGSPGWRRP